MTNFILPHSQKHILTNSVHDDPLNLFTCLRFFHSKLDQISVLLDQQNTVSFKLYFESEIKLDHNFFFQLPMFLMSAETISFQNLDKIEDLALAKVIKASSEQRFFEYLSEFDKVNGVSFHGLYPSKVPPNLSSYNEILGVIKRKNLLQVPPTFECRTIKINHFGNVKHFTQCSIQFDDRIDFKLRSKSMNISLLIKTNISKKHITCFDFNHPNDENFAKHFEQFFNEHLSKILSFELFIWNDAGIDAVSREPRGDAEVKNLLNEFSEKILTFLNSETITELKNEIKEQKLLAAVKLLDKRKRAIVASPKIETEGGFRFKVPSNEYETVILFSAMVAEKTHPFSYFEIHEYASSQGIDSISTYKIRQTDVAKSTQATEYEHKLSNFFKHGHPIQHTEIIICWRVDPCPYELIQTDFPWLYNLSVDGQIIPVVEIQKFPNIRVIS